VADKAKLNYPPIDENDPQGLFNEFHTKPNELRSERRAGARMLTPAMTTTTATRPARSQPKGNEVPIAGGGATLTLKVEHVDYRGRSHGRSHGRSRSRGRSHSRDTFLSGSSHVASRTPSPSGDRARPNDVPIPTVREWLYDLETKETYSHWAQLRAKFEEEQALDITIDKLANFPDTMFIDSLKLNVGERSIILSNLRSAAEKMKFECTFKHGRN
jgi:hypothetical protein